jgi:hypothetical protein
VDFAVSVIVHGPPGRTLGIVPSSSRSLLTSIVPDSENPLAHEMEYDALSMCVVRPSRSS